MGKERNMALMFGGYHSQKQADRELEEQEDRPKYEKPKLEEQKELVFPRQIAEKFNDGRFCMQCSGCHGCR